MGHKHSFFIYNDGSGCAYCMGCDIVLNEVDVQDVLNNHYKVRPTKRAADGACTCGTPEEHWLGLYCHRCGGKLPPRR